MSQSDPLIISVDAANNSLPANETYNRSTSLGENRILYRLDGTDPDDRDELSLARSFPKRSGNFRGVKRTSCKFTKDIAVPGVDGVNVSTAIIVECSFSIPIGTPDATVLHLRQKVVGMLDNDTIMDKLNVSQEL